VSSIALGWCLQYRAELLGRIWDRGARHLWVGGGQLPCAASPVAYLIWWCSCSLWTRCPTRKRQRGRRSGESAARAVLTSSEQLHALLLWCHRDGDGSDHVQPPRSWMDDRHLRPDLTFWRVSHRDRCPLRARMESKPGAEGGRRRRGSCGMRREQHSPRCGMTATDFPRTTRCMELPAPVTAPKNAGRSSPPGMPRVHIPLLATIPAHRPSQPYLYGNVVHVEPSDDIPIAVEHHDAARVAPGGTEESPVGTPGELPHVCET
jgi:hypothetical protein